MMNQFTPTTPLGLRVQALLRDHTPAGMTEAQIRRALRRASLHISQANLAELLAHRNVFTHRSDGTYVLSDAPPPPPQPATPPASLDVARSSRGDPLLIHLPQAQTDYVVFDLETTGLDAEQDAILQIAAIKVSNGQPVDICNWYVNPGSRAIPYSVQRTLGMDRDPSILEKLRAADELALVLPAFLGFVGDLPLVAHNARFDAAFLDAALGETRLPNPIIDTMEIALLVAPQLPAHRLEPLGEHLGVQTDELVGQWRALEFDRKTGHTISRATLHNAITDVFLLHHVYRRLCARLQERGPAREFLAAILPELYGAPADSVHADVRLLEPFLASCRRSTASGPTTDASAASTLLHDYVKQKGYTPRPVQFEMASLVQAAMDAGEFAMVEAPTGTGKTLAYLSAAVQHAAQHGQRVALSTAYRNLQDQLIAEIQDLLQQGGAQFHSQVLKGVANYLCWSKLIRYWVEGSSADDAPPLSLTERFVLAYVALRLPTMQFGTQEEISYWLLETFPLARAVIRQLQASAACAPRAHNHCDACPMPTAYANAQSAHILVINHALWLRNPQRMPGFETLVLDEAHTLEDVATEALTQEVSSQTLAELLERLYDERTERGLLIRLRSLGQGNRELLSATAGAINSVRQARYAAESFGPFVVQFIRRCAGHMDRQYGAALRLEAPPWKIHPTRWPDLRGGFQQLFTMRLPDLCNALHRVYGLVREDDTFPYQDALKAELSELLDGLVQQRQLADTVVAVGDQNLVYWLEVGPPRDPGDRARDPMPSHWALKAAPIDIGTALQAHYDRHRSIAFVSATLALRQHDFSYFIDRLGLAERLDTRFVAHLPPVLPYAQNVFLGLTDYLTYAPNQTTIESFQEELASELELLLRFTDGRALALFTARSRMLKVATQVEATLAQAGLPLLVQTPGRSNRALLEEFRDHVEATLFGLRSFWEGVDVPGESLSFVLMEKLPFPLLTDPVHRARAERLIDQGRSEFDDYLLPLMLLQVKQGFGRLMRRESDRGAVILFDRRIHRKSYITDLLATLPGYLPRQTEAERSRRRFYTALAQALPGLIDLDAKSELLLSLPADILLDFERKLVEWTLPPLVSEEDYPAWRATILDALQALFGHAEFRILQGETYQETVIRHILTGRDVLGVLPTGSGKSLTFQLTALLREGVTLVLSPLIALMKDQIANLRAKGIEIVGAIYSGQSASERDDVFERMQRGRARLVYISPERLRDPQLLAALRATQVTQIVVDEAHCVDMWGPSFRPDFLYVPRLYQLLKARPPVAALTATATPAMQTAIIDQLALENPARVIASVDRPELRFIVYNQQSKFGNALRGPKDQLQMLMRILQAADATRPPILVYVATTVLADQLARQLRVAGYDARAYHGKLDAAERASVQELFMDDHINIVVCTKAFGMGIDKPNIRYVVHYNLPSDLESYYQEAGRAGRDGKTAYCILLYHPRDLGTQQYFIENGTPDQVSIDRLRSHLAARSGAVLYEDPDILQEELGMEEVSLRMALHYLEQHGYLQRSADFTLRGSLTLLLAPEEALAAWRAAGEAQTSVLAQILQATHWPAYRKLEVDLLTLARTLHLTPPEVEDFLLRLSRRGEAVYRPWQRGFTLHPQPRLVAGDALTAGELAAETHRQRLSDKLRTMQEYGQDNRHCRRATILRYFGETPAEQCEGCDVCLPNQEWPWSLVDGSDSPTPDAFMDPAFVVLETVKWNLDRARKYGAPYGVGMLQAVLKGDQYSAARYVTEPRLRQWRLAQMRGCPYWGIFATLPAKDRVLDAVIQRLLTEGYLCEATQTRDVNAQYTYLDLTDKGVLQLTSGKLFHWSIT